MGIEQAILQLEGEIAVLQPGTKNQPGEGTTDWFVLRALALGLSNLRRMKQLEVQDDPAAAERFYRRCSNTFKQLEVPDPVEAPVEAIQDG